MKEGKGDKKGIQFMAYAKVLNNTNGKELIKALSAIEKRIPNAFFNELIEKCIEWYENDRMIVKLTPDSKEIYLNSFDGTKDTVQFTKILNITPFRSKL